MRRILMTVGLAAMVAAPSMADAASCGSRKTTGTVLGAVTGGLLGRAVAGHGVRTEGTLLGAGVGGLVGRQVGKSGCNRRTAYYRSAPVRSAPVRSAYARPNNYNYASNTSACRYENRPFYNERGELVYASTRVCGR
jgi:hypothetical protein